MEKYLRRAVLHHPRSLHARVLLAHGQETLGKNNAGALETYRDIQALDKERKLDASPTFDVAAKIKFIQSNVSEEMKHRISGREPAIERKVSK